MVSVNHVYQDSSAAGVFKHQRSERSSKRLSEDGDLLSLTFKKDQGGGIGGVRRQKRNVMYRYLYRQNHTMGGFEWQREGGILFHGLHLVAAPCCHSSPNKT